MENINNKEALPIVGITLGDINGVGPEVVIKALHNHSITKSITPVIYGSTRVLSYYRKMLNISEFNYNQIKSVEDAHPTKVNVINCWDGMIEINPGQETKEGGDCAYLALEAATKDLIDRKLDAMVTAPVSKNNIQREGFNFPGHTEYITEKAGSKGSLMLMVAEDIRIAVATGHIPLSEVSAKLTAELLKIKIVLFIKTLKIDFKINKPRLAVLGLNPHAGENGLLGKEELDTLIPVIEEARQAGHLIYGPFPADGFFGTMQFQKFDGVLAMYHDQGLAPFKTLAFEQGVNYTAGLPIVRTSPDHGTAFNIAGKGEADATSISEAIFLARDIVIQRKEIADIVPMQ